jgi:polyadenylation factor subunit 2
MLHPLDHLLASASNGHMTRFWARKRPGDLPSVLAPCCTKPAAAGPDDNADGKTEDEHDAPAVSGFASSASIVGAGAGRVWKNSIDNMGVAHVRVSPGADDNAMPGFNGGGNGSGGAGGSGSGLMANARVRRNCPSMSSAAAVDGRGRQQADGWAYQQGGGDGGGCRVASASLTLRYNRIYSICATGASNRDLVGTESTSG